MLIAVLPFGDRGRRRHRHGARADLVTRCHHRQLAHPGDCAVPGTAGAPLLSTLSPPGSGLRRHAIMVQLAGDGTGDLQVQANVLNGYVTQALAAGSSPVTVIGYSAGGWWLAVDVDYKAWPRPAGSSPSARAARREPRAVGAAEVPAWAACES